MDLSPEASKPVEPKGESKYRYKLLFPVNFETHEGPMFDRSDVNAVMKAAEPLALALHAYALRIDGYASDGTRFTAAVWSPPMTQERIEANNVPPEHRGGWKRILVP